MNKGRFHENEGGHCRWIHEWEMLRGLGGGDGAEEEGMGKDPDP